MLRVYHFKSLFIRLGLVHKTTAAWKWPKSTLISIPAADPDPTTEKNLKLFSINWSGNSVIIIYITLKWILSIDRLLDRTNVWSIALFKWSLSQSCQFISIYGYFTNRRSCGFCMQCILERQTGAKIYLLKLNFKFT